MTPKTFATLAARFALLGYELTARSAGHVTLYRVARGPQAHVLSHPHDVHALLRGIQSQKRNAQH